MSSSSTHERRFEDGRCWLDQVALHMHDEVEYEEELKGNELAEDTHSTI